HRLTEAVPQRIPHADAAVDEVRLEGTWNADLPDAVLTGLLAEVRRVLRPGGTVVVHGLAGDRPFPGKPNLPRMAALVQRVRATSEVEEALRRAGFTDLFYEQLGDIHCFRLGDVELRELRLVGRRPADGPPQATCQIVYKGPLARVTGEDGTTF